MKRFLTTFALLAALMQLSHAQHEHHRHGDAAGAGSPAWTQYDLVLRAGHAQGIEQCFFMAAGQAVTWDFVATADLLVNFHVHPDRDGEYHTIYLERADDVRDGSGVFPADEAGAYCFEFGLRQPLPEAIGITLRVGVE